MAEGPPRRLAPLTPTVPQPQPQGICSGCRVLVAGLGSPQGQPQAGSPSTPGPASNGTNTVPVSSGKHRNRGWRDWRKDDPTRHNSLWKSVTPLGELRVTSYAFKVSAITNSSNVKREHPAQENFFNIVIFGLRDRIVLKTTIK